MSKETTIVTYTGRSFDVLNPRSEDICITDIAHSLALTNRYRGHTRLPYSVAEHCVHMASLGIGDPLICLLHDAAEAYIGDQSSPQKKLLWFFTDDGQGTTFKRMEHQILLCIGKALGIADLDCKTVDPEIRFADGIMLATEVRDLMPRSKFLDTWYNGLHPSSSLSLLQPWDWEEAEDRYIDSYKELTNGKS